MFKPVRLLAFTIFIVRLYLLPVAAQTADSVAHPKGFFKNWRLAGIELNFSGGTNKNEHKKADLYNSAFPNGEGADKIAFDRMVIQGFAHHVFAYREDRISAININAVFKPRQLEKGNFLSHIELIGGISFKNHYTNVDMGGDSLKNIDSFQYYYAGYSFDVTSLGINLGATLQSPSLGGAVALYTGIVFSPSYNYYRDVYLGQSVFQQGSRYSVEPEEIIIRPTIVNPSTPKINIGLYVPVGLKLNISARSNLSVEYVMRSTNYLMPNGWYSVWHNGLGLGYRYKLGQKTTRGDKRKGAAAQPAPFY